MRSGGGKGEETRNGGDKMGKRKGGRRQERDGDWTEKTKGGQRQGVKEPRRGGDQMGR